MFNQIISTVRSTLFSRFFNWVFCAVKRRAPLIFAVLIWPATNGLAAEPSQPPPSTPQDTASVSDIGPASGSNTSSSNSSTADESPMMLYLVPWNANPESHKNGKKITLYQPWGVHFDPLTPAQAAQLNAP